MFFEGKFIQKSKKTAQQMSLIDNLQNPIELKIVKNIAFGKFFSYNQTDIAKCIYMMYPGWCDTFQTFSRRYNLRLKT